MAPNIRDEEVPERRQIAEKKDESRKVSWAETGVKHKLFSWGNGARNHTGAGWGMRGRRKWRQWIQMILPRNLSENKRDKSWEGALRREKKSLDKQLRVVKERAHLEQVKQYNELGRQTSINL